MKLYTHKVNPHYSATHADFYFEGWRYVTSTSESYPVELMYPLCLYKHETLEAAEDTRLQLEEAIKKAGMNPALSSPV